MPRDNGQRGTIKQHMTWKRFHVFLDAVRRLGGNMMGACKELHPNHPTFCEESYRDFMKREPKARKMFEEARETAVQLLEHTAFERTQRPTVREQFDRDGNLISRSEDYGNADKMLMELLRVRSAAWREAKGGGQSVTVNTQTNVAALIPGGYHVNHHIIAIDLNDAARLPQEDMETLGRILQKLSEIAAEPSPDEGQLAIAPPVTYQAGVPAEGSS